MTININYAVKWQKIPWRQFEKTLAHLQHKIYQAIKNNDLDKVKTIQNIILDSSCARYLAVKQVTEFCYYKQYPGIDGLDYLSADKKILLAEQLKNFNTWPQKKLKKIYLYTFNGEKLYLNIATLEDRAMYCLIKYILEPIYYYHFSIIHQSYIFSNDYRNLQNQMKIMVGSYKRVPRQIYHVNLAPCFQNCNLNLLINDIILPKKLKPIIKKSLKFGIIDDYFQANAGLTHILINSFLSILDKNINYKHSIYIRYNFEIFFLFELESDLEQFKSKINDFINEKGLIHNSIIIQEGAFRNGFVFLYWSFRIKRRGKLISVPSKINYRSMVKSIKNMMKNTKYPIEMRIDKVIKIYYDWLSYNRYSDFSEVNLWYIKLWCYRYIKKNTKINSSKLIVKLKEHFNVQKSTIR
uniref:putative reverse transcriptase/maturase n=1 Tax=Erythrolobus coxiae TaxID=362235 RepID=UPI001FCD1B1C|nr:putative reverse transcriptase/maturase [Erythrolobus coxiae]UNJ17642.1 putative reverse transcriptase/maturase [Erythrolobus coxiae]